LLFPPFNSSDLTLTSNGIRSFPQIRLETSSVIANDITRSGFFSPSWDLPGPNGIPQVQIAQILVTLHSQILKIGIGLEIYFGD